jgi:NADPH2:quinone reductase
MRAIVVREFGEPDVLRPEEMPDPVVGPDEVLVRMHAAGVNPVDAYIRTGTYARKPSLPYVPGTDGAGQVEAVGANVKGWKPGDRVWVSTLGASIGTYAERVCCPPDRIYRLPDHVSYAAGAALGVPAATAHRALFGRAAARSGETILVHGASGSVGLAVLDLAKDAGLRVFATAGTDKGMRELERRGADAVLNHHDAGRAEAIRQQTGGRGVDVIIEMLANVNLDIDLGLLAPNGRVVVVGNRGRIEIDPRQAMARDSAILGMSLWNVPFDGLHAINLALTEALQRKALSPAVDRELPLAEASRAHAAVIEGGHIGKIALTM